MYFKGVEMNETKYNKNSTEIIEKMIIFCLNITKSLCSIIFLIFAYIVSYIFNELWVIFHVKYILIVNLLLLIVFHPQHLEGLIKVPSILLKIINMLITSPKLIIQAAVVILVILWALLKILWNAGFGWILGILCFLIRGIVVSIISLVVFSIILTSVYVMAYIAFLKPIPPEELSTMLPKIYTTFGGLALLGVGIEIMKHFISQPQKIAEEEFKKWGDELKKCISVLFKLAKNSFPKFLKNLLNSEKITKEEYDDLLEMSSHFFTSILDNNENENKDIPKLKKQDNGIKYLSIIILFINTILGEILSKNESKLISEEEKNQIKKMWSELMEDLIMILPYTTYPTITLNYIASLSYLDLKRFLKLLSEYFKNEEIMTQMGEKIENKK